MKVGLSPTDKAVLTKLPELIYQQVNQNVGEAADNVKVAITKHTESTLKSVDEACVGRSLDTIHIFTFSRLFLGGSRMDK